MSWLYLQVAVEDYSRQNGYSDGKPSAMSKKNRTRSRLSKRASKTDISMMRQSGMKPTHSTGIPGLDWWMSSLRDSRASHSAMRERDLQIKMIATDGLPPSGSFAKYDPQSHGWKTLQALLHTNISEPFSETWRKAGMVSFGIAYRQKPLERITRGIGFGYLPTPKVSSGSYDNSHGKRSYSLRGMALHNLWPTPLAGERDASPKIKMDGKPNLAMLARAFPTPQATSWGSTGSRLQLQTLVDNGHITEDEKRRMSAGNGGQLNPNWVEWLMGWPIGWTDLKPLATGKFQKWLEAHSFYFCND